MGRATTSSTWPCTAGFRCASGARWNSAPKLSTYSIIRIGAFPDRMSISGRPFLEASWAILFPCASVNQRAPSGPGMMAKGRLDLVGTLYSMITCAGTFADRLNSNAASNASSGIRGCLRVNGNIVLLEASTTGRPEVTVVLRSDAEPYGPRAHSARAAFDAARALANPSTGFQMDLVQRCTLTVVVYSSLSCKLFRADHSAPGLSHRSASPALPALPVSPSVAPASVFHPVDFF